MLRRLIFAGLLLLIGNGVRAQDPSPVAAKGMWIWQLWNANGGNLNNVITQLEAEGVTWVVIKMADGNSNYNSASHSLYNWAIPYGGMDSVVSTFHKNGIRLLGFQYVYGRAPYSYPYSEADVANQVLSVNGIDGLLVDAEIEYDTAVTRDANAQSYMDTIIAHHPNSFVALTSWARIVVHATFPWETFLDRVKINMPQTYWAARPLSPATELSRMSSDFTTYTNIWVSTGDSAANKPIEPIGQAEYFGYGNIVKSGEVASFASLSQTTYHYPGISLWEYTEIDSQYVWSEYAAAWPVMSVAEREAMPTRYELLQNYPNPFNPRTKIQWTMAGRQWTIVNVFDVLGRKIATLANEMKEPGTYAVDFDGSSLPSGVYFYRLQVGDYVATKKLILLR